MPRAIITPLTDEENGKWKQVYDAVLRNNPTLDAEGDALGIKLFAFQKVLVAAMVKADPKVEPLLKTLYTSPPTHAQVDEELQAQSKAMQSDPTFQTQWDALSKKLTAHQQAVDAAMVKLDPTMAPILAKFSP
jgi:hypothetical protein